MKSQGRADQHINKFRQQSEAVASLLKQLAHPQRLLILCSLVEGEKSVSELEADCEASQSAVSQFLKNLRLEGLVDSRREGKQIFYRIVDKKTLALIKALYLIFCK